MRGTYDLDFETAIAYIDTLLTCNVECDHCILHRRYPDQCEFAIKQIYLSIKDEIMDKLGINNDLPF